jgi:hypothetical protein
MKKYERMTLEKNAAQVAKGRRRAMLACRDAEGRFVKMIQPDDQPESGHIIITTTTTIQD